MTSAVALSSVWPGILPRVCQSVPSLWRPGLHRMYDRLGSYQLRERGGISACGLLIFDPLDINRAAPITSPSSVLRTCIDCYFAWLPPEEQPLEPPRWVPDAHADDCMRCGAEFSFFVWRHHCRRCGACLCSGTPGERLGLPLASAGVTWRCALPGRAILAISDATISL